MGRTANTPATPAKVPELLPAAVERIEAAQSMALSVGEQEEMMNLGRRLGQIEAAAFIGNISDGVVLSAYENVKKSKAWTLLTSKKDGNAFPNLDAFCQERLGYSARRLAQIISNRELIGKEAFEQSERLGLRQVDYNAIKALPAPDQELLRRAVEEAQSRDEVLDLLQELAARHAKEKEALTQQAAEAKAEAEAKEQRLKVVRDRLEQAEQKADLFQALPPDERLKEIQAKATDVVDTVLGHINGSFRGAVMAITQHDDVDRTPTATGWLLQIQAALDELRDLYNLRPQAADGVPEWERWAQQQDALKSPPRAN